MDQFYEIDWIVDVINRENYQNIALQFPDNFLNDSVRVVQLLKEKSKDKSFFVLADTSYGHCCIDEVAAEHLNADCLVHFGFACFSAVPKIPILYVFGKRSLNLSLLFQKLDEFVQSYQKIYLVTDLIHFVPEISNRFSKIQFSFSPKILLPTDKLPLPVNEDFDLIIYVGNDNRQLTVLNMKFNKSKIFVFNPETDENYFDSTNVNKVLVKRLSLVSKAKEASIYGILSGSLNIQNNLKTIQRLKQLISDNGKKSYQFVVGKLNIAKLANFPEIQAFILISCPFNSLLDSKEFMQPVISPFELELSFCEWKGDYSLDLNDFLVKTEVMKEKDITMSSKELVATKTSMISYEDSPASHFLLNRSYQGLERNANPGIMKIIEGRKGIARGYVDEGNEEQQNK